MNKFKQKIKNIRIPFNQSTMAFAFSIFAVAFAVGSFDSPCLSAQSTCAIGSDNIFSGNISLKGGTANKGTFDAAGMTADRTWTLPDASGTLAVAGATLPASKVMATDVSGNESTTNVYPLSLTSNSPLKTDGTGNLTATDLDPETDLTIGTGLPNQVLGVNSGASALTFTSITGVPSLTADKSVATDGTGALTTTDVYPLTLTASTPLKTNGSGEVTASDLDITTDITPGSALQQIRTNAAGNSLEFFTPSGGGAYTLIDSGTIIANPGSSDEVFTCWYGNTLDGTKKYKLIFDGGTGLNIGASGYNPGYVPIEGDCTLAKQEWEANSYYATAQLHVGTRANSEYETYGNKCYTIQGADPNHASSLASNIQGHIQFSAVENGNGYGLWSEYKMSAVVTNGSGVVQSPGIQWATGSCLVWDQAYTNPFSDITGFMHYFEGGFPAPLTRKWALYEIDY